MLLTSLSDLLINAFGLNAIDLCHLWWLEEVIPAFINKSLKEIRQHIPPFLTQNFFTGSKRKKTICLSCNRYRQRMQAVRSKQIRNISATQETIYYCSKRKERLYSTGNRYVTVKRKKRVYSAGNRYRQRCIWQWRMPAIRSKQIRNIFMHLRTLMRIRNHIHAYIHIYMHSYIHACSHALEDSDENT